MKVVDGLDVPKHDLVLRSTRIIIGGKEIQNYTMLLFKTWKQFRVHSAVFTGKDKNVEEWGKRSVKYDVSLRFIFSQHEKNELSEEHVKKNLPRQKVVGIHPSNASYIMLIQGTQFFKSGSYQTTFIAR